MRPVPRANFKALEPSSLTTTSTSASWSSPRPASTAQRRTWRRARPTCASCVSGNESNCFIALKPFGDRDDGAATDLGGDLELVNQPPGARQAFAQSAPARVAVSHRQL